MSKTNNITQERLKELLDYNPETGIFTRKIARKGWYEVGDKTGTIDSLGYYRIRCDGVLHLAHRLAFLYVHGYLPREIDHINNNKSDNRIENLRSVTRTQNLCNVGKTKSNTSGQRNIYKITNISTVRGKKYSYDYWCCEIKYEDNRDIKLFPYTDEGLQQAIAYRDKMLPILHGEFANNG